MNDEISIDEEMVFETESAFSKDDSDIKSIVPFFKALSELRKAGALAGENKEFKRDIRFEELIMDPSFNPATLTDSEVVKLNEYMDYIQSVLINDDKNKLLKAISNISKGKKVKVKHRWRDIKKKG